jgi:hypothetical protein
MMGNHTRVASHTAAKEIAQQRQTQFFEQSISTQIFFKMKQQN